MAATTPAAENKALVRRLYEAIDEKDDDELLELYASDYVVHGVPGTEEGLTGRDALEQYLQGVRAAFPDMTTTIEAMVAEDDLVAARASRTRPKGVYNRQANVYRWHGLLTSTYTPMQQEHSNSSANGQR